MMAAGMAGFWLVSADVLAHGLLARLDGVIGQYFFDHRNQWLIWLSAPPTRLGDFDLVFPLALGGGTLLALRKRWRDLLVWGLAFLGAALIPSVLKEVFRIPRPTALSAFSLAHGGFTYPSGHTFGAMTLLGVTTMVLWRWPAVRRWRRVLLTCAIVAVLAVAWGLVYTVAHWLTDVLAALALCTAWLGFCLWVQSIGRATPAASCGS
jgi:undecaprenyl-diphosphatase